MCGFKCLQLLLPLLPCVVQVFGLQFEAPRQCEPGGQALVEQFEALGVELHAGQAGVHVAHGVLQLCVAAFDLVSPLAKFGGNVALCAKQVAGAAQAAGGSCFVAIKRKQALLGGINQFFGMGQALVLGIKAVPLVSLGLQVADFGNLPLQALAFVLALLLALGGALQLCAGLAPLLPKRGKRVGVYAALGIK